MIVLNRELDRTGIGRAIDAQAGRRGVVGEGSAGEHEPSGLVRGGVGTPVVDPRHLLARPRQLVLLIPDSEGLRRNHSEIKLHEDRVATQGVEDHLVMQAGRQHSGASFKRCRIFETRAPSGIEIDRRRAFAINDGQWAVGRCSRGGQFVHEGKERGGRVVRSSAKDVLHSRYVGEVTVLIDFGGGHDSPLANEFQADV